MLANRGFPAEGADPPLRLQGQGQVLAMHGNLFPGSHGPVGGAAGLWRVGKQHGSTALPHPRKDPPHHGSVKGILKGLPAGRSTHVDIPLSTTNGAAGCVLCIRDRVYRFSRPHGSPWQQRGGPWPAGRARKSSNHKVFLMKSSMKFRMNSFNSLQILIHFMESEEIRHRDHENHQNPYKTGRFCTFRP